MVQNRKEPRIRFHVTLIRFSNGAFGGKITYQTRRTSKMRWWAWWASHMSQILISSCLSQRQVQNKIAYHFHRKCNLPLLTLHGLMRRQWLIQFVHGLGCSTDYEQVLWLEMQIALNVLKWIHESSGVYKPSDVIKNEVSPIVLLTTWNSIRQCTTDGNRILRVIVIIVYQEIRDSDPITPLSVTE